MFEGAKVINAYGKIKTALTVCCRKRQAQKKGPTSILQNLVEQEEGQAPQVVLLHQLFSFIGSSPERAVSIAASKDRAGLCHYFTLGITAQIPSLRTKNFEKIQSGAL